MVKAKFAVTVSVQRVSAKKRRTKSKKSVSKKSKKSKSRTVRKTPVAPKGKKKGVRTIASKTSRSKSKRKPKRRTKLSEAVVKGIEVTLNHTVHNVVTHTWNHVKGETVGGGPLQSMIEDRLMVAAVEEKPADKKVDEHKAEGHEHGEGDQH